jgi:predicted RNase H-like HicB family nuclease
MDSRNGPAPVTRCYAHVMRFTAVANREGRFYVAQCLEVEVASQGETVETALANLREALELKLEGEPNVVLPMEPPIVTTVEVTPKSTAA